MHTTNIFTMIRVISRLKKSVLTAAIFIVSVTTSSDAFALKPMGYERFTEANDTGVVFGWEFADLQAEFSSSSDLGGGTLAHGGIPFPIPERRVIDIEIRRDEEDTHNVVDAVWIENSGDMQEDSWLLNNLTTSQLLSWTGNSGFVLTDIEKYFKGDQVRWAAILQRNPVGFDTMVLLNTDLNAIFTVCGVNNMRVLELDFDRFEYCDGRGEFCAEARYNAILVQNAGDNYLKWNLEAGWSVDPHVAGAYQLVDSEKLPGIGIGDIWFVVYLSVAIDNDYKTYINKSQFDLQINNMFFPAIDLEVDPDISPGNPKYPSFYSVHLDP